MLVDVWSVDRIVENSIITPGLNLGMKYGITEEIAVFGNYQYAFKTRIKDGKELDYLLFHDAVMHQNFNIGLQYNLGSTSSKWRYGGFAGMVFATSSNQVYLELSKNYIDFQLRGTGFMAGGNLNYFIHPYLSTSFTLQYMAGNYNQSEYLGISYKEKMKFSSLQALLGLSYHFGGR